MSFTFDFTADKFAQLISHNTANWYTALCDNLPQYEINTPERVAAFIAQCAHESGGFKRLKENLNYKWESLRRVFPKYFPTDGGTGIRTQTRTDCQQDIWQQNGQW